MKRIVLSVTLFLVPVLSAADAKPFVLPPAPPPRARADVEAVLKQSPTPQSKLRPLSILLLAGPRDHHPGEHEYQLWQDKWKPLLAKQAQVSIDTAYNWPSDAQLKACDLFVVYAHPNWDDAQLAAVDDLFARGAGVVLIHWAVRPAKDHDKFAARFGLAFPGGGTRHGAISIQLEKNPLTAALPERVEWTDETYWPMLGDRSKVTVLASSMELPKKEAPVQEAMPQIWTCEHPKGRAFCFVPGHYLFTFDDPFFRILLLRGMAWAAGEEPHRFESAATDGVELK